LGIAVFFLSSLSNELRFLLIRLTIATTEYHTNFRSSIGMLYDFPNIFLSFTPNFVFLLIK